jgi:selenium metabolism protein YedF
MTKKALGELSLGEQMQVLVDNGTSKQNIERFLKDNHARVTAVETQGVFTLTVTRQSSALPQPNAESYCTPDFSRPHLICFKSDTMGFGDESLGSLLVKAFVNTIKEASPLPATIVFYNRGIYLAIEGSPVTDALGELQRCGVSLLVCGTCLDYYGQKENLKIGTISNMYAIMQALTSAGHVIYP